MNAHKRQEHILSLLDSGKFLSVSKIIERTKASPATVRRDLTELEKDGLILRAHGAVAARSVQPEPEFSEKLQRNYEQKRKLAEAAISLISHGDCIFIDAGSTCHALAELLDPSLELTVVTNSFASINALANIGIDAWCLGGKFRKVSGAFVGSLALEQLLRYRFDLAFLGASALDESGIYTTEEEECAAKQRALKQSRKTVLLADPSKTDDRAPIRYATWKDFDVWPIQGAVPRQLASNLKKAKCSTEIQIIK